MLKICLLIYIVLDILIIGYAFFILRKFAIASKEIDDLYEKILNQQKEKES
jgi:hypothetical protein